jgi:hypothetical protein
MLDGRLGQTQPSAQLTLLNPPYDPFVTLAGHRTGPDRPGGHRALSKGPPTHDPWPGAAGHVDNGSWAAGRASAETPDGRGPAGPYGTVMTPGWNGDVSTMPPQALISAVMEIVVFEPGTDTVIFGAGVQVGSLADGVGTQ